MGLKMHAAENDVMKTNTIPATVTENEQTAEFPESSVNVYVTTVVPTGNESSGEDVDVNVTLPESSVAEGSVHVTVIAAPSAVVSTLMSPGQSDMTGGVLSMTAVCNRYKSLSYSALPRYFCN